MNSTSMASAMSSRPKSHAVPAATSYRPARQRGSDDTGVADDLDARDLRSVFDIVAALDDPERLPGLERRPVHRTEEVRDRLVRLGGDPDRFPAAMRARAIRAPVYVLPVPGGPWIASRLSSRFVASRIAAVSGSSSCRRSGSPGAIPRIRGGTLERRSRTARLGPGPWMPWSMTCSARTASASCMTRDEIGPGSISAAGWVTALLLPRLRSIVPPIGSKPTTPPGDLRVRGSTQRSSPTWILVS